MWVAAAIDEPDIADKPKHFSNKAEHDMSEPNPWVIEAPVAGYHWKAKNPKAQLFCSTASLNTPSVMSLSTRN